MTTWDGSLTQAELKKLEPQERRRIIAKRKEALIQELEEFRRIGYERDPFLDYAPDYMQDF